MRFSFWWFLSFLAAPLLAASPFWVIAQSQVTLWHAGQPVKTYPSALTSWSLDSGECKLYGSASDGIVGFNTLGRALISPSREQLVSPVSDQGFFTTSAGHLQWWSRTGTSLAQTTLPSDTFVKAALAPGKTQWLLTQDAKETRMDLQSLDPNLAPLSTTSLVVGSTLWGEAFLTSSKDSSRIWAGYTRTKIGASYSPVFEEWDFSGRQIEKYDWKEKGIFLGMCETPEGRPWVARDLPSATGFTLPVVSLFEIWDGATMTGRFSSDVNWLTESLTCSPDGEILFTERSLSGGGYRLSRWNGSVEILFTSSEPLLGVAACSSSL